MKDSKIEWTHHTFNPWIGCTRVSPGCVNCYAETLMADRYKKVKWGPQGQRVRTSTDYWRQPLKWNREAAAAGERRRVFCASLADVFEDKPDQRQEMDEWRYGLFNLIMETRALDWLLLTKRPENVKPLLQRLPVLKRDNVWDHLWAGNRYTENFPNVWIGTSVENQEYADKRIPELLKIPAAVRFLSIEPMLGTVDLKKIPFTDPDGNTGYEHVLWGIDWVIVGGESGKDARPMHPDWVRSVRDQCVDAGVPFFFKQWGEWGYRGRFDSEMRVYQQLWIDHNTLDAWERKGKHRAGRLLDGREWNEFPTPITSQPAATE